MTKILIVEDEKEMARGLKDNLEFEGYEVLIAPDGEAGSKLAREASPDLILLDLMLPRKSGFDVCRELRGLGLEIPVIILTARGEEIDKVLGLELGADDYITKPFSVRELLARVKAVLRRIPEKPPGARRTVKVGRLTFDPDHLTAYEKDREVELTHREYELLKYFVTHKGLVVSRDQLLDEVWGYDHFPTSRTVDNYIVKLRKKIEEDPVNPKHIVTVYGIGYKYME
ncbi:response regulator transcription factor [bacterium]|nr:response regulator transcription factor [bacterium]